MQLSVQKPVEPSISPCFSLVNPRFSAPAKIAGLSKRHLPMDEEDERKRMSTPDDERSSDSGFRDKESCEEEESPLPGPPPNLVASQSNTPRSTTGASASALAAAAAAHDSAEEEQLRILFELDTILDAECYGGLNESLELQLEKPAHSPAQQVIFIRL